MFGVIIIINRLANNADQLLEEEQADFRLLVSTTKQTLNLRLLVETCLEHQKELLNGFIDFRKVFDCVH